MLLEADVEPDRGVEGGLLVDQQVLQVVAECLQVVLAGEVVLPARPLGNRVHDPANELFDAPLAIRTAHLAAEILGNDDIRGLLRPETGDFDVTLLEDDRALLVAYYRRPGVPLDFVERIDSFPAEKALEFQTRGRRGRIRTRGPRAVGFYLARAETLAYSSASLHVVPSEKGPNSQTLPQGPRTPKRTVVVEAANRR